LAALGLGRGAVGQVSKRGIEQSVDPFAGRTRDREYRLGPRGAQLLGEAFCKLAIGEIDLVECDQTRLVLKPFSVSRKLVLDDAQRVGRIDSGDVFIVRRQNPSGLP